LNPQDEILAIIDAYLTNGMSEEERFAFEEKMNQNEILAAKVSEMRLTNEAIYYASLAELKNTIGKDIKNVKYKEPFNWKKASYISIFSLAILSGIITYVVTNNTNVEQEKTDQENSIKEINKDSLQKNGTNASQEKINVNEKAHSNHTYQKTIESKLIQKDNLPTQKSILHTDDNLKNIGITKSADVENKINTNLTDLSVKKTVTPEATEDKIICDKSFKINTDASCKLKETGSIQIVSDAAYSYTFQVDIKTASGSKGIFYNMAAGVYEVLVTYGKECTYTKKVTISEKWCALNESYSFNPDYNEKWAFNYENGASGTFTIFDKQGKNIYSNTFGSGNEEWNGNDRQGMSVPVGIYVAFLNYSDGRKEKVELTIVR
jgi:hypothetical protein